VVSFSVGFEELPDHLNRLGRILQRGVTRMLPDRFEVGRTTRPAIGFDVFIDEILNRLTASEKRQNERTNRVARD
jgi:hypothetical protein